MQDFSSFLFVSVFVVGWAVFIHNTVNPIARPSLPCPSPAQVTCGLIFNAYISSRCLHVYVQFQVNLVLINRLLVNTTADTQKDTAWLTMYLAGQLACLPACHVHILVVQYLPFSEWRWTYCIWCYLVSVRLVFARKRVVHFFIIPFYMPGQQEVLWLCVCVCVSVCFLIETPYSFIHLFFFEPNYLPCLALSLSLWFYWNFLCPVRLTLLSCCRFWSRSCCSSRCLRVTCIYDNCEMWLHLEQIKWQRGNY